MSSEVPNPPMIDMNDSLARRVFQAADDAWSAALTAAYGKNAGDARYDPRLNGATPELAALKAERDRAMNDWHQRNESRRRVLQAHASHIERPGLDCGECAAEAL